MLVYDEFEHKFKSIDNFIQYIREDNPPADNKQTYSDSTICSYAVNRYPDIILSILQSEHNKPSVYDLHIVRGLGDLKIGSILTEKFIAPILDIYKNRK